jgi:hypothetical protein
MPQGLHDFLDLKRIRARLRIPIDVEQDLDEHRDRAILPGLLLVPAHTEHVQLMQRQVPKLAGAKAKLDTGEAPESLPGDGVAKGPLDASSVLGCADAV